MEQGKPERGSIRTNILLAAAGGVLLLGACLPLPAQITTSTLCGRVCEADSSHPVAGVAVSALHEPTGARSRTVSAADGSYILPGLRSGGPYTVTFSTLGYAEQCIANLALPLGEATRLDAVLSPVQLDAATVSQKTPKLRADHTGSSRNIPSAQMEAMPTISRNITDYIRLSPYANGLGLAGGDGRTTHFTVDGANFNNNYGLSASLPGGGNPLSIEAIDQIQLVISPYDVRESGFVGGGIHAVTKSGSNAFQGAAYTGFTNEKMQGQAIAGKPLRLLPASHWVWGATAGGPLVKDKLFFFLNYEQENRPGQVIGYRARMEGETPGGNVSRTLLGDMQRVADFLRESHGYDPGSATEFPGDNANHKALVRMDWNIRDAHRLTLRYNYTFDKVWNAPNDNSSDTGYRLTNTRRVGPQSMAFAGNMYGYLCEVHSAALDCNSRMSGLLSNQFLATFTHSHEWRTLPGSQRFPHVDIMMEGALEPYMSLGDELFSHYTDFTNTVANFRDEVTLFLDAHRLMAGLSHEFQQVSNCYMRNGGLYYRYASVDDFIQRKAPESFALTYGFDGIEQPKDEIAYQQVAFFVQDEWQAAPRLKLSGGLRLDGTFFRAADFQRNEAIYALALRDGLRIDTGRCPAPHMDISPRLGFRWDIFHDGSLSLHGGSGLFLGRLPLVYFMNVPSYANLKKNAVQLKTDYTSGKHPDPRLEQLAGAGFVRTREEAIRKFNLPTTLMEHTAPYQIVGIAPRFQLPQHWKTTLAVDWKAPLPFPLILSAEGIFSKTIHGALVDNVNLDFSGADQWERFAGADNRLVYPADKAQIHAGRSVAYLTNTSQGYGVNAQLSLETTPFRGLSLHAAYAFTDSRELTGFPGTDLYSAFANVPQVDGPGRARLQRTQFVVPHKVTAFADCFIPWKAFHGDGLRLGLFYCAYSPAGYSYVYTNDMNGDGVANDLMYIPRDDSEIAFVDLSQGGVTVTASEQRAAFWAFVEKDAYLRSHKGQYAGAYEARPPFVHRFDLRIAEDFTFMVGKTRHKVELSLTVLNFMNIFDSAFGVEQVNTACNGSRILRYAGRDTEGRPTFTLYHASGKMPTEAYERLVAKEQAWRVQVGLKYAFH